MDSAASSTSPQNQDVPQANSKALAQDVKADEVVNVAVSYKPPTVESWDVDDDENGAMRFERMAQTLVAEASNAEEEGTKLSLKSSNDGETDVEEEELSSDSDEESERGTPWEVLERDQRNWKDDQCVWCMQNATETCSACQNVVYCSHTCQRLDWPVHKQLCAAIKQHTPRPTPSHRLALAFPQDQDTPELKWINVDNIHGEVGAIMTDSYHLTLVEYNARTKKAMAEKYMVFYEEYALVHGKARRNRSIDGATRGNCPHNVRGEILVLREDSKSSSHGRLVDVYSDITLTTFRHFIDNLIHGQAREVPVLRPKPEDPLILSYEVGGTRFWEWDNILETYGAIRRDVEDAE